MSKTNENQHIIVEVMLQHDCQTAKSIACDAYRIFGYEITPASVSGVLRVMAGKGLVGLSKDGFGKTFFWLDEAYKAKLLGDRNNEPTTTHHWKLGDGFVD